LLAYLCVYYVIYKHTHIQLVNILGNWLISYSYFTKYCVQ